MSRTRKIVATGLAASALVVAFGGSAGASSQYVQASVVGGVSVGLNTAVATQGGADLTPGSTATIQGGTLTVNSNGAYTIGVTFDKTRMTEWNTGGNAYVATTPKTLASPIVMTATPSAALNAAGAGVGTATSGTGGTITGVNLLGALGGTGSYTLTYAQPIGFNDAPGTYRIQTTFTGSSAL